MQFALKSNNTSQAQPFVAPWESLLFILLINNPEIERTSGDSPTHVHNMQYGRLPVAPVNTWKNTTYFYRFFY